MAARSRQTSNLDAIGLSISARLTVLSARLFSWIAYYTPIWLGYLIADIVGHWMFWRHRAYRESVIDNLRQVYRGEISDLALRRQARWVFRVSARNFWDLLALPRFKRDQFASMHEVVEGSWHTLDHWLDQSNGAILITGHVGSFDFVGQYFISGKYRPLTLTAPTVSPSIFAGITYLRSSQGARIEVANSRSLRHIIKALRNGETVVMVADRDFSDSGQPTRFFDKQTKLPSGPVKLARELGVPLIPLFTYRADPHKRERRFHYRLGNPIYIERTDDREADVRQGMNVLAAILERYISIAPEQWVMFRSVWPSEPAG